MENDDKMCYIYAYLSMQINVHEYIRLILIDAFKLRSYHILKVTLI